MLCSKILPVLCVGENLEEREEGKAKLLVGAQVKAAFDGIDSKDAEKVTVAYEPVWAIGTGKTATPEQANDMCVCIRETLTELYDEETADRIVIQYGGLSLIHI